MQGLLRVTYDLLWNVSIVCVRIRLLRADTAVAFISADQSAFENSMLDMTLWGLGVVGFY